MIGLGDFREEPVKKAGSVAKRRFTPAKKSPADAEDQCQPLVAS